MPLSRCLRKPCILTLSCITSLSASARLGRQQRPVFIHTAVVVYTSETALCNCRTHRARSRAVAARCSAGYSSCMAYIRQIASRWSRAANPARKPTLSGRMCNTLAKLQCRNRRPVRQNRYLFSYVGPGMTGQRLLTMGDKSMPLARGIGHAHCLTPQLLSFLDP
jgi:hypothetical protein